MRRFLRAGVLGGATALAACAGNPPVSPMDEIPIRAPIPQGTVLLLQIPSAPPVRHAGLAELRRGAPAVCADEIGVVATPRGGNEFMLVMSAPGFAVTRESVFRQRSTLPWGEAPEPSVALNLAGANNGRCDYFLRLRQG
ncbi:hypothetical protein [Muricoccus radiodurans]|uniref:hypothetical protein n=1 Tax=Muricoccus radiodurans TaxID=2231721 RepID=UPI003CEC030B